MPTGCWYRYSRWGFSGCGGMLHGFIANGSWWGGMAFLVLAAALELTAARWSVLYFHRLSLLPCLAGVVLLVLGWGALRWSGPSIAFLVFMFPFALPLSFRLSELLQRVGAVVSAFILQVIGIPAFTEGTIIILRDSEVEVAEACSGIRILAGCCVVALGLVLLTQHRFALKAIVVASAVPIALGANIARITLTAILQAGTHRGLAHGAVHDLLGLCAPVVAVGLLFGELELLRRYSARPSAARESLQG